MSDSRKGKTSNLWNCFQDSGDCVNKVAICNICKVKLSYKSSTSNLKKHLERKHPTVQFISTKTPSSVPVSDLNPRPSTSSSSDVPPGPTPGRVESTNIVTQTTIARFVRKKVTPSEKKKIDDLLMQMFIFDYQPFSIVQDRGFRAFVEGLNPSYDLPDRKVLSNNYLPALYESCMTELLQKIEADADSVCLTTDIWSSSVNDGYLGITAHYIDKNFVLTSALLDCAILPGSNTAENIKNSIGRTIQNWKLKDKILIIVSDNASNMKSAVEKLGYRHFGCYAHTINLIVKHCTVESTADEKIRELINKVKTIVSHYKKSVKATEKLVTYQRQNGVTVLLKVLQDVTTRWNSTLKMLERFVHLENAIKTTIALSDDKWDTLTQEEWRICRELCVILKPFDQLTEVMSGEKYVTGSQIIILTRGLVSALSQMLEITDDPLQDDFVDTLHELSKELIMSLRTEVERRLPNLEASKTIGIATMLDPRFKLHVFKNRVHAAEIKKSVTELVTNIIRNSLPSNSQQEIGLAESEDIEPTNKKKRFDIWGEYHSIVNTVRPEGTPTSQAILEIQRYLELPLLGRKENPLEWWHTFSHSFPNLATLAKRKLNFLATSVPCERLFSKAGNIINERRTRLGVRKVQQLLFLNSNYKPT